MDVGAAKNIYSQKGELNMKSPDEIGNILKKAIDDCGLKSISSITDRLFIGYDENGVFCVEDCHLRFIEHNARSGVLLTKK